MADEFARIAELRRRLGTAGVDPREVLIGIGDDAAVLAPGSGRVVLSVDAQVDGVHFRQDLLSPGDIGARALSAALSDLAAMGARPRAALLALVLPPAASDELLYAIADGMAEAAGRYGCPVIGGNLARGSELSLTTTVVGECERQPLTRSGARAGDALFVAGELGGAALGLHALLASRAERAPDAVARWRRPVPLLEQGLELAGTATAAIDVSDGFLQDLAHVADASRVGFEVELARLPLAPEVASHAAELGRDPAALALAGGEDYALVFTAAPGAVVSGTLVGRACAEPGIRLRSADGAIVPAPTAGGFDHFAARKAPQPR